MRTVLCNADLFVAYFKRVLIFRRSSLNMYFVEAKVSFLSRVWSSLPACMWGYIPTTVPRFMLIVSCIYWRFETYVSLQFFVIRYPAYKWNKCFINNESILNAIGNVLHSQSPLSMSISFKLFLHLFDKNLKGNGNGHRLLSVYSL